MTYAMHTQCWSLGGPNGYEFGILPRHETKAWMRLTSKPVRVPIVDRRTGIGEALKRLLRGLRRELILALRPFVVSVTIVGHDEYDSCPTSISIAILAGGECCG